MIVLSALQGLLDIYVSAYRAGDAAGCVAVFTADAVLTSPYAPAARGRGEIEALHRDWVAGGAENKKLEIVEFGGADRVAWCLARFSEGEATGEGVSLNIFERQSDGGWLIRMCSLNAADPSTA